MLDFAGANTKRQGAKGAVRRSVAVAANKSLAWLRDAQFRTDDMHDALVAAVHVKEPHAKLAAVLLQRIELQLGIVIEDGQRAVGGGDRVVHHRERKVRPADLAAFGTQSGEGLRRSTLMDQMPVNINERGLAGLFPDNVVFPNLLIKSFWWHGSSP